jgi:hypothetical protein
VAWDRRYGYPDAMSDEARDPESDDGDDASEIVTTPFEKPFFMPVLLFALALWFGYDGWFNEEMEWIKFNRWVFAGLMVLVAYTTWQDVREVRRIRESDEDS